MRPTFISIFFLFFILLFLVCISASHSQCLTAPVAAACTNTEPLATDGETLNSGTTKWYYGTAVTFNTLKLNGGTLIVCGNLTVDKFYMDSGKIFIQQGGRFVIGSGIGYGLGLKGNSYLYNYGTLEILRNLSFENGWATPAKPNVLINATRTAVLKMNNQYLVINNANSWFVNKGRADFHGLITDPQASPQSVCLGKKSETVMTVLYNKVKNSYFAPEPYACVSVSEFTQLWDTLSNLNPYIHVCLGLTHRTDSTCMPWGCKPSWGLADIFRRCSSCSAIQVLSNNFLSFTAEQEQNGDMLYWEMENYKPTGMFFIETSADGAQFAAVHSFTTGKQNTKYNFFNTANFTAVNYYRIKYMDTVSKFIIYSNTIKVKQKQPHATLVYPNPFADQLLVVLPESYPAVTVTITDMYGRNIDRQYFLEPGYQWQMKAPHCAAGMYMVTVSAGGNIWTQKIVKK